MTNYKGKIEHLGKDEMRYGVVPHEEPRVLFEDPQFAKMKAFKDRDLEEYERAIAEGRFELGDGYITIVASDAKGPNPKSQ